MDLHKARFLPFNAVNEFMRDDYRTSVIRETLSALPNLPPSYQAAVDQMTKKAVQTPGFRNSAKAPLMLRQRGVIEAFGKNPGLVAAILSAWGEMKHDLRQVMYDLLTERGWGVYPPEADRTHLPGFMITWPKNEDFQVLNAAFKEKYPEAEYSVDDISLMAVWVSVRLPYALDEEEEAQTDAASAAAAADTAGAAAA